MGERGGGKAMLIWGVLAYVLAQLGIAAWATRRIKTEDDYLVAGRQLGPLLATFTIFATWFGAETCMGSAGEVYQHGIRGGTADPFGYAGCLLLMGLVFAVPFWRAGITTLGDLFLRRFSVSVERLAVLLLVPISLLWAAAQVRAFGQVLAASSDFGVDWAILIAASIVILYTVFGGMLADAWTDLVQGIALAVGLITLIVLVAVTEGISFDHVEPERLQLFSGVDRSFWTIVEDWAIPVLGSVVTAELVARIVATRSPECARRSCFAATGIYIALGGIPVVLALVGMKLVPGLEDPEQILPRLAQQTMPGWLYILFAGALVSAILSTVDSALLVAASLISHNVIVPLRKEISEAGKVRIARICVALLGVLTYVIAVHADGVYALVEEASAFGSSGIVVVVTMGLFTPLGGSITAFVSLLVGVVSWIVVAYFPEQLTGTEIATPYLISLACAFGAYLLTALLLGERGVAVTRASS